MPQLNCLIEGEDKVFTVTAAGDDNVSILKKSIQQERALGTLKGVDPHDLELWKVDIDINAYLNDGRSLSYLKLENLEPGSIEPLQSWKSTSKYWSGPPPDEFIHIIVKGAPAVSRLLSPHTPEHSAKWPRLEESEAMRTPPNMNQTPSQGTSPRIKREEIVPAMRAAFEPFAQYITNLAQGC